jgi:threonine/homoserine/homoserine lactone efflux protein
MPDASTLALFALASFAIIVVPGPAVLYVVTRSIAQGRRAGMVSMFGIEAGGLVHVAAAAIGLSALIASSATAFTIVKFAGAAYLIYLGVRRLLEREEPLPEATAGGRSTRRLFAQGMLVNVLNPKTAVFFLAFLPQFVHPAQGAVTVQILVLGLLFVFVAMLSDGAYALAAGTAGEWIRSRDRFRQWLARFSGGVYIALGVTAAFSGRPATSK